MPFVDSAATARQWATERAIDLWVIYASDFDPGTLMRIRDAHLAIVADGGKFAVVIPEGGVPTETESLMCLYRIESNYAPEPWGIFSAMAYAGVQDVRKVGVLAAHPDSVLAAQRAGCGAIVALADEGVAARWPLIVAQADVVIAPEEFAALDKERYCATRAHRQRVLLNPGPSVVSDRVHRAIGGPDLCHREPEYSDILERVRSKLLDVAGVGDDWAMAMLAGSGTSALESMVLSSVRPGKKLLVCRNGVYGDRAAKIAERAGVEVVNVPASDLTPIDPAAVAAALDANPDVDAVFVVHHETTTGLLNPVQAIAKEADKRGVLVAVDAISSLGAEDLELRDTGIDMVASTSNKCLHGLPGAAFVLISPRGQRRIEEVPPKTLYFDLAAYLAAQKKRTVPFTPAIPALYSLDAALDELMEETLAHRKELYAARMDAVDRDLAGLGLTARVAPEHRSRCVRSFPLPEGYDYDTLHDQLKDRGYIVYAGLGEAAKTTFRVCALGSMTVEGMEGFTAALAEVVG